MKNNKNKTNNNKNDNRYEPYSKMIDHFIQLIQRCVSLLGWMEKNRNKMHPAHEPLWITDQYIEYDQQGLIYFVF